MPETQQSPDHDLIITLISEVRQLKEQIKDLSDNTKLQIVDHETRIRSLEASKWKYIGIGAAINFLLIIAGLVVTIYYH